MQNRALAVLVAFFTYAMRWLALLHSALQRADEHTWGQFLKFVAVFLSIPCFHLFYALFKFTYLLRQRRLTFLGAQCALLGGHDFSKQFDNLTLDHDSITDAHHAFRNFISALKTGEYPTNGKHIAL